jgi:hypothetical protein
MSNLNGRPWKTLLPLASAHRPEFPLTQPPMLRFAVGTFDTWAQLGEALRDLCTRGLALDSFNCLAFERLFAGRTILAPDKKPIAVEVLPFPESSESMACTSGPLTDCLMQRVGSGAQSLKDALGHWLIPRHAAHFHDAVEAGKILFWIRVVDALEEHRAYQCLLACSSNSVGVHDLMLERER